MQALKILLIFAYTFLVYSFTHHYPEPGIDFTNGKEVKCMVQLINYEGEGAYIIVSVIDQAGKYQETLRVLGDDEEWYPDLTAWWAYQSRATTKAIDGITGATIAGGERSIFALNIDEKWIDKGYKLRFETAVEEQKYHEKDLEFDLSGENLNTKIEGGQYIRYVRLFMK